MRRAEVSRAGFILFAVLIVGAAAVLRLAGLSQYPPGPHYDEAVNLLVARSIAFGGARPFPILEAYQGREVLYFYLNAPLLTLIHDSMFPFHLTNAFSGVITTAAGIALGRAMFPGRRGVVIGLAVGAMIAVSFPLLWLQRQAFRAVTLPLMQSLALVCLWRGLRAHGSPGRLGVGWLVAGGVLAGAALYTYNSSRLFPVWLAVGGAALLVLDRQRWRVRIRQGAAFFAALVLTALPMAMYAAQRPDIFFNRLEEVTQPGQSISLVQSLILHARMFFIEGDPYLRYNIPGRPYFTLPEGVLMLVGMGAAAWRLTRSRAAPPLEKAAYVLALLAPLMVLPSVISVGGLPPSHMRSSGMIPLIFVLIGVGYDAVVRRLARSKVGIGITGIVLFVVIGAVGVGRDYFTWAGRADVYYETDADLAAAGEWARTQQSPGELLYVAARDRGHPTVMIANLADVAWIGTDSLVWPPPGTHALAVFPRSAPPQPEWAGWLEPGRVGGIPIAPDERPAFDAFRLDGDAPPAALLDGAVPAARTESLMLTAFSAQPVASGGSLTVIMAWRVVAVPAVGDLTPLIELENADGFVIARVEPYLTETNRWRVGEHLVLRAILNVPPGTLPGDYAVRAAWVARAADQYQTYQLEQGAPGGIWAQLGTVTVMAPTQPFTAGDLPVALPLDAVPGSGQAAASPTLIGLEPLPGMVRPGESLPLVTHWSAGATPVGADARVGYRILLGTETLWDGAFHPAPAEWGALGAFTRRERLTIPREFPAGSAALTLEIDGSRIALGNLNVQGVARIFDAPPVEQSLEAVFGEAIRLHGYTVRADAQRLQIVLVWQAVREMQHDYTVFVHLLDVDERIIAQIDQMPVNGRYPTTVWAAGEYIVDPYDFPTIAYHSIRVGLYLPQTGVRLLVNDQHFSQQRDNIVIGANMSGQ
ncbi:MAG: hypothetical protein SF162_16235 [bacterium]|nr:hypothetical protein [bacterium]